MDKMDKMRITLFTFTLIALAGAAAACWATGAPDGLFGSQTPAPDSGAQLPVPTTMNIPTTLTCHVHDGKSTIKWPNVPSSDALISDISYMVSDGDLLWAATSRGLVRLRPITPSCTTR
jgi:hypothetical protein